MHWNPGIVSMMLMGMRKKSLDVGNAGHPSFCDALYFPDEIAARDLCRANLFLGVCLDWRVLIRIVERIPQ